MQCPHCKTVDLVVIEREGVEIDYCPTCRGVWLERNELEQIIQKSAAYQASLTGGSTSQEPRREEPRREEPRYDDRRYEDKRYDDRRYEDKRYEDKRYYDDRHKHDPYYHKKKKGGFLEDLFDF
jgi:uncharacterized protein